MVPMTTQHTAIPHHPIASIGSAADTATTRDTADTAGRGFHPLRAMRSLSASLAAEFERRRMAAHWSRSHRSRRNRPPTRNHLRAQWEAEFRGF